MSARRVSLRRLMWAGYYGGSVLKGRAPQIVQSALEQRFDVVTRRVGGLLDFEFRCYDPGGRCRMVVKYGWMGNGWVYEPMAVRTKAPLRRSGDVIYHQDGSWRVAA